MGLECRILPTSTRNLRQTKAEMRRELEELRWNMRSGTGPGSDLNNPGSTASPNIDMQGYSPHDYGSGTYSNPSARTDGSVSPAFESRPPTRKGSDNHTTLPRVIDGYFLDGAKIDECFRLWVYTSMFVWRLLTSLQILYSISSAVSSAGHIARPQ